jgi:hypothetical protein
VIDSRVMSKEALVATVKSAVSLVREGKHDEAFAAYRTLYQRPDFMQNRPEDQRQALKLLILTKRIGVKPTPALHDAHRAALEPLTELVSRFNEPEDYEMLGACHALLGNEQSAAAIFREGLRIERERNAGSDLCGSLMTRLSAL